MAASTSSLSTEATGASSSTAGEEHRPEAGPLPRKRGELGYREEVHGQLESTRPEPEVAPLPARHPADRDAASSSNSSPPPTPATPASTASDVSSINSASKRQRLFTFLKSKKVPNLWGIRLTTFLAFLLQLCVAGGTIAAWVITVRYLNHPVADSQTSGMSSTSSTIFIYVVFGVALLGQMIFLERRIFLMRAQRYAFVHPGEILPSARQPAVDQSIAFSPWNRPPLPTYAAALAQSGVGTGDVEDHIIAQPPPPAYGNTRGSRLLLTGYLNDTQRAQRPASQMSQQPADRPVSYMSHDDEWEVIQDAGRALQLEQTLARLEQPSSRT